MWPSDARKTRRALNLSQANAADAIGVTPSMISLFESGQRKMSHPLIIQLEMFYNRVAQAQDAATTDSARLLAEQTAELWGREGMVEALTHLIKELQK